MSLGFPNKTRPKSSAKGGGLFLIILLAIGAFILFSGRFGDGNGQSPLPGAAQDQGTIDENPDLDDRSSSSARRSSTNNDWSIEEVPASKKKGETGFAIEGKTDPVDKSTKKGDWSLEEVDTDKDKKDGLKFSEESGQNDAEQKKTKKGDWEIEEKKGTDKGTDSLSS